MADEGTPLAVVGDFSRYVAGRLSGMEVLLDPSVLSPDRAAGKNGWRAYALKGSGRSSDGAEEI